MRWNSRNIETLAMSPCITLFNVDVVFIFVLSPQFNSVPFHIKIVAIPNLGFLD